MSVNGETACANTELIAGLGFSAAVYTGVACVGGGCLMGDQPLTYSEANVKIMYFVTKMFETCAF